MPSLGWWNAHVVVGGARVGLGWRVVDGGGNRKDYKAKITVKLPNGPTFDVQTEHFNENVLLDRDPSLICAPNAIAAEVTYYVTAESGATGRRVEIKIVEDSGLSHATNKIWAVGSGLINQSITVPVEIPGSC